MASRRRIQRDRHLDTRPARAAVDQHAVAVSTISRSTRKSRKPLRPLDRRGGELRSPWRRISQDRWLTAARAGVVSIEHMAGVVQAATGDPSYVTDTNIPHRWTAEEKG